MNCSDCGAKLINSICPNCQEELYIFENQYQEEPWKLSNSFEQKIKEQKEIKEQRKQSASYYLEN